MMKNFRTQSTLVRLVASLLFCSAIFFFQIKLQAYLPGRYMVVYPGLFVVSWMAGFFVATVSIVYVALLSLILYSISPMGPNLVEIVRLCTFTGFTFIIALLIEHTRKSENKLKAHLEKNSNELSSILEGMQDAFAAIDRNWNVVMVNRNYELLTKIDREQSIGHCIWELFPKLAKQDSDFWIESHRVMETGRPSEYETFSPLLNTWVEVRIYPKENGIAVFFKNILARKMAENALLLSENNFKQLADSIPHIIWTSKACGTLDFYNARFYDFTGIEVTDKIEQSWQRIVHPDDYQRTLQIWDHSLLTMTPYRIEYRLLEKKTQSYRWFLGLALPVKNKDGEIIKWFGSCTDIEAQKNLAHKIEGHNSELENALLARDEFLSIASHELKTPLTSLKLHTQHFKKGVEKQLPNAYSPERINALAMQVDKQVYKLNRLVDDMLDISRIRTGKLTLRPQEFQMSDLINEVQEILQNHFISSNCPVPIIENNCQSVMVVWDKIRIEQVLINLFTNALRYGAGREIILKTELLDEKVVLHLKDHGIGIATENLDKIFNRFEKIRNPTEVSGLGLGLFISKQIINAHNGAISVESQLGAGSLFKIELPRQIIS